ncbi:class I SAM-dependent DNA methyltransferase [Ornithinibacillus halophilus]|uniref:Methyltransferase domain-containing protein n=1 Tax=Ornithinibacillus halophilus TaxID=930117 RepID=A0A1M5DKI6_9BACI|nr:class I SAM-dependent methyltransferase [Ornithinibacillus halophilus]SHF67411.1 Methyltransferase domain-containing protein [Ornithinibacillus halophilus]
MAYQHMALLYDQLMEDAPYDQWVKFTEQILEHYQKDVKKIADLGCGTGEITIKLALEGYDITGVDNSSEMLSLAEQKASNANVNINWLHQDLTELTGLNELDVAVSYCDVINYIPEEADLTRVFKRVYDSLEKDGVFIFDVHSLYHVENHLVNQTFADVTDDASYIWFCVEGETPGEMYHELTFFAREDNTYKRFDETHHQRTYPIEHYKKLLKDVGFDKVHIYGDFSIEEDSYSDTTERIFVVAEK